MNDLLQHAFRIRAAMNKMQRDISIEMQKQFGMDLTRPQCYLLSLISNEEPCKITHLAKKLGVRPSTISTMINRLVDDGFVSREYGHNDRRNVLVSITLLGKEVLKKDVENYGKVLQQFIGSLESTELETFTRTFEKIAAIHEAR
ncbi:MarR family transcriptional regulator [Brevibacillus brevis]|uniref:MarR family transcriptional regulator n=1 Tax=Brevibacillus brevis TaxID=1393 RepID=A0ABY9T2V8_BREBE|nr:MarR family transcriptional regulator [Brevibacillus brevis]WNC14224.1 MarR family transcriptional regulator [Brevibacillus brevis]